MEVINHHTLSDFRMSGKASLDELFSQVLGLLSADGLITLERVMHDGPKIRAKASADTFRREDRIREYLKVAEQQIGEMGDPRKEDSSKGRKRAMERASRERKAKLEMALAELEKIRNSKSGKEAKEKARVSVTDPEARIMKEASGGFVASYNAQISTDSANGIVVGVAITQSRADYHGLMPALDIIKDEFGRLPVQMVVDGGFTSRENIIGAADAQVDLIGSIGDSFDGQAAVKQMKLRGITEDFYSDKFIFNPENNNYTCPEGKTLNYRGQKKSPGKKGLIYWGKPNDCMNCPSKKFCCPTTNKVRTLIMHVEDPVIIAFKEKMETEQARQVYKQRGPVAEFTNAWIKTKIGLRQFCVQGLKKAELELKWACLALNVQQWVRLKYAQ
jgi:hypothetical protein